MEIQLNFDKANKKLISQNLVKLFESNLKNEEDRNSATRILKGKKLQYMEANSFIQALLSVLSIEDGEDDHPIHMGIENPDDTLADISSQLSPEKSQGASGSKTDPFLIKKLIFALAS